MGDRAFHGVMGVLLVSLIALVHGLNREMGMGRDLRLCHLATQLFLVVAYALIAHSVL